MIRSEIGERERLIMHVQTGQMTASEAARQLGVSRKTFYQHAQRGLAGMATGLAPRPAGRPGQARDAEKEALAEHILKLQREKLGLQRLLRVRELIQKARAEDGRETKKKAGAKGRGHRSG